MCLSYLYDIVVVVIALDWLLISIILINYDARDIQLAAELLITIFHCCCSCYFCFCYNGPTKPLKSSLKIRPLSLFLNVLTEIYASFDSFTYARDCDWEGEWESEHEHECVLKLATVCCAVHWVHNSFVLMPPWALWFHTAYMVVFMPL